MKVSDSAGLESPGTVGESDDESTELDLNLSELINLHEDIDWGDVPGITPAEAGAWTARLVEARDGVNGGGL